MAFEKDITKYPELTDENPIAVLLANDEWGIIVDWLSHLPYNQSRSILEQFRDQTVNADAESTSFEAVFTVSEYNRIIGSLSLAPYYVVAELITKIHSQAVKQINEWRELYSAAQNQKSESTEQ